MAYKRNKPHEAAQVSRIERRFRINKDQSDRLDELEKKFSIPASALVRLALDCFLPKIRNENFKEEGIFDVWNSRKF